MPKYTGLRLERNHIRFVTKAVALASLFVGCVSDDSGVVVGSGGVTGGATTGGTGSGGAAIGTSTGGRSAVASSSGGSGSGIGNSSGGAVGSNASGGQGGNNPSGGPDASGGAIASSGGSSIAGRGGAGSGIGGRMEATGGRSTGGSQGVGVGGQGGGAASSSSCPPFALICEDFEDGKADGWSPLVAGMAIDSVHARSGRNALSLNIPANGRGGFITRKGTPLFPLLNKSMWGRTMLWFDSISDGHTDMIRGQSAAGGNPAYNVGEQHGAYMLNYYNGSSATDCWARPKAPTPTVVPLGKWMCWEWNFNSGTNSMQFFVDGTLYRAVNMTGDGCLTGNGPWVAPPEFGSISVGAYIAETRPTIMQLWIDDIAIGTEQRIGCPAP